MSKKNRSKVDYSKISDQGSAAESAVQDTSLFNPSNSTSAQDASERFPKNITPVEDVADPVRYVTVVGNLNIRKGPGKGFDCVNARGHIPEDFHDQYGRLNEGAEIYISDTTVDGAGNVWGNAGYGYICLEDSERGLTFAKKENK